jgi:pilus assembly protein CpaF
MSTLTRFIPDDDRIVLVEERQEIHIRQKNVLRFESSQNHGNLSSVTTRDVLEAALAHRPDRIIVGDVRGEEAFDLLELMSAGYSGILACVQANGALQAISRFTRLVVCCEIRRRCHIAL